jgi:hypothetical protein
MEVVVWIGDLEDWALLIYLEITKWAGSGQLLFTPIIL